jgi:hypothetical protein
MHNYVSEPLVIQGIAGEGLPKPDEAPVMNQVVVVVVMICSCRLLSVSAATVLSATRDLAVSLVDVTQHTARLSEALATLLSPYELRDHPQAAALITGGAAVDCALGDSPSVQTRMTSPAVVDCCCHSRMAQASRPSINVTVTRACISRSFSRCRRLRERAVNSRLTVALKRQCSRLRMLSPGRYYR